MDKLFADIDPDFAKQTPACPGQAVEVAINANVWNQYDYLYPAELGTPQVGMRVRVGFGRSNRATTGFITALKGSSAGKKLKPVKSLVTSKPQIDDHMLDLARWISCYYLTPLGMVLAGCVPSAIGKHKPKQQTVVFLKSEQADWPGNLGASQKKVLDELNEARKQGVEPLTLEKLLQHSGAKRDAITRLIKRDLISTEVRPVTLEQYNNQLDSWDENPFELNTQQQAVLDALEDKLTADKFSATLIQGVTGSGKTEVYVRAIKKIIAAGKQAILMTPEIALATQTTQRLIDRLPRVAILHSGLTDAQRSFYWHQIESGNASVIIGPRSAVFAPARNLGLIVVDEEHESSYKQDSPPRYHGRDVAIKRAHLAGVPILLGSATPSMESFNNAKTGKFDLLKIDQRVRDLPMPKLKLVNLRQEMQPGKIELIGRTLGNQLAATLDRNEQAILLMNRRGYASYVFCPTCKWTHECPDCLRPMVWHQAIGLVSCHHCGRNDNLPERCPACDKKIVLFGYGIQRIEDELARKFPLASVARMDSDTMTSPKQFQKLIADFSAGDIDILLGTQMVAKGLDFPNVSLVGVASADTSLAIHDFRAAERTFQLIVQVAGRAGRGSVPGQVIVQTIHGDEPAIQFAQTHDYESFAVGELTDRQDANLPPFSRMCRFVLRHEKVQTASKSAEQFAELLKAQLAPHGAMVIGPMQAEFAKLRNQFRFHVLVISEKPGLVQRLLYPQMNKISRDLQAELVIDPDPMSMT